MIGADKMSSLVDYTDRATCVLFGDGAGAVLVEATEEENVGVQNSYLRTDGQGLPFLHMKLVVLFALHHILQLIIACTIFIRKVVLYSVTQ